jgi:peptidoglycan/LPS O-acetylase OafA/YrhL
MVLKWRFLAFTGMFSYSLFLLHDMVLRLLISPGYSVLPTLGLPDLSTAVRGWVAGQNSFAVSVAAFSGYTLAFLLVAFPISYLSYRYIERPFLSYRPK